MARPKEIVIKKGKVFVTHKGVVHTIKARDTYKKEKRGRKRQHIDSNSTTGQDRGASEEFIYF